MMIQTYLMARYSRHPEMQEVAAMLKPLGYMVCSRWIWGKHSAHDAAIGTGTIGMLEQQFAQDDMDDLRDAALCIGFSDPMRTPSRGGRHVELGMALAWDKKIILVGGSSNVFHALPQIVHVPDAKTLYAMLGDWRKNPRAEMPNSHPGQ